MKMSKSMFMLPAVFLMPAHPWRLPTTSKLQMETDTTHIPLLRTKFHLPPIPILATTLVNELDRIETEFIVVLDDIHLQCSTSVMIRLILS